MRIIKSDISKITLGERIVLVCSSILAARDALVPVYPEICAMYDKEIASHMLNKQHIKKLLLALEEQKVQDPKSCWEILCNKFFYKVKSE